MIISAQLTREAGELVMRAIDAAAAGLLADSAADNSADAFFKRQADALVQVASGFLAGNDGPSSSADHYQVMVHVDEAALRDVDDNSSQEPCCPRKSDLPIESVRRLLCDTSVVPVVEDDKGLPFNIGRKKRVVSPPMKRALRGRDRNCRFPGCSHDKWLDAHHVKHWVDGGETSMANTLLLCARHHRLLHEGGFSIHENHEGVWYFRNRDGRVLPSG